MSERVTGVAVEEFLSYRDPELEASAGAIVADMMLRERAGMERYGVSLSTHNGRDALIDCYEELLDAYVYAMQFEIENDEDSGLTYSIARPLARVAHKLKSRSGEGFLTGLQQQPAPKGGHNG